MSKLMCPLSTSNLLIAISFFNFSHREKKMYKVIFRLSVLLYLNDKSIDDVLIGNVSGRHARNRAAVKPSVALSRKFRKGCLVRGDGTRGESGRHWFRSYKSAPTRNYPPSPVREPVRARLSPRDACRGIRSHGLIAFENGEKWREPRVPVTIWRPRASLSCLNANVITTISLSLVNRTLTSNRSPIRCMKFEKGERTIISPAIYRRAIDSWRDKKRKMKFPGTRNSSRRRGANFCEAKFHFAAHVSFAAE